MEWDCTVVARLTASLKVAGWLGPRPAEPAKETVRRFLTVNMVPVIAIATTTATTTTTTTTTTFYVFQ